MNKLDESRVPSNRIGLEIDGEIQGYADIFNMRRESEYASYGQGWRYQLDNIRLCTGYKLFLNFDSSAKIRICISSEKYITPYLAITSFNSTSERLVSSAEFIEHFTHNKEDDYDNWFYDDVELQEGQDA